MRCCCADSATIASQTFEALRETSSQSRSTPSSRSLESTRAANCRPARRSTHGRETAVRGAFVDAARPFRGAFVEAVALFGTHAQLHHYVELVRFIARSPCHAPVRFEVSSPSRSSRCSRRVRSHQSPRMTLAATSMRGLVLTRATSKKTLASTPVVQNSTQARRTRVALAASRSRPMPGRVWPTTTARVERTVSWASVSRRVALMPTVLAAGAISSVAAV